MVRGALLLLAVSGCDLALGVKHVDEQQGACGPYTKLTEIPISGVVAPRGFSISADETMALVTGTDGAGQTRPIPLRWNGSSWEPDMSMQKGLDASMKYANLAAAEATPMGMTYTGAVAPVMLVSTRVSASLEVGRYYWSGTTWTQDQNQGSFAVAGYDVFPGNTNVRVGTGGADDRVRSTVFWEVALNTSEGGNKIAVTANDPNNLNKFTLADKGRTIGLNNAGLGLGQAVMTEDRSKLVFATKTGAHADIYAVEQSAEAHTFDDVGAGVGPLVNTGNDEVEPWINEDCSKLYFRQIPAEAPTDPGRIYVAE